MSDYTSPKLRELVSFDKGKPPLQQPYYGPGAELYLTPEYLRGGARSEPIKASPQAVRVVDGDTIVLWDGSNAGEVLWARSGVLASTMTKLSHSNVLEGNYFYYAVKALEPSLKAQTAGSGIPHVDKEVLGKMVVQVFDKPEQVKIAEILSSVDAAIEQTDALIAKQKRLQTGLMQDLLTRGVDEHGNIRSEETHEFKDSPLGRIPVEWDVRTANELCREIVVGIVIRPVQYYRPNGVSVLRSANVRINQIDPSNLVFMSEADNEMLSKSKLAAGDLVTVRTGYPGTTAVVPPEFDGSNCVDLVISRPDKNKVSPGFLAIWINSAEGMRQVAGGQGGLAQQHFNVGSMKSLLVKVPELSEQERIEELLTAQALAIGRMERDLAKLRSLKIALMQDLLTGKKRVTPLLEKEQPQEVAHAAG